MIQKLTIKQTEEFFLPLIWSGKENQIDYDISLSKEGASIRLLLLILGNGESWADVNIKITHEKPQTKSMVIVRGILGDSARINFNGLVKINKGSYLSNAWLAAHLLLNSDRAKGRAIPSLEILENDIKAGHATTVGKINEAEIFYLMSRGVPQKKAKQLIVAGFLSGFLNDFPDSKEKNLILKQIKHVV